MLTEIDVNVEPIDEDLERDKSGVTFKTSSL